MSNNALTRHPPGGTTNGHAHRRAFDLSRTPTALVALDNAGFALLEDSNVAFAQLVHLPNGGLLRADLLELVHPDDRDAARRMLRRLRRDADTAAMGLRLLNRGSAIHAWIRATAETPVGDGGARLLVLEAWREHEEMRYWAGAAASLGNDVTGLPGRDLLMHALEQALATRGRRHGLTALILVQLQGFDAVLRAHGSGVGGELLMEASNRATRLCRAADTLVSLGSGRFAIVVEAAEDMEALAVVARVQESLERPFRLAGEAAGLVLTLAASASVALTRRAGSTAQGLLSAAEGTEGRPATSIEKDVTVVDVDLIGRPQAIRDDPFAGTGLLDLRYLPVTEPLSGRVVGVQAEVPLHDEEESDLELGSEHAARIDMRRLEHALDEVGSPSIADRLTFVRWPVGAAVLLAPDFFQVVTRLAESHPNTQPVISLSERLAAVTLSVAPGLIPQLRAAGIHVAIHDLVLRRLSPGDLSTLAPSYVLLRAGQLRTALAQWPGLERVLAEIAACLELTLWVTSVTNAKDVEAARAARAHLLSGPGVAPGWRLRGLTPSRRCAGGRS